MKKTLSSFNHGSCSDFARFFIPDAGTPTDLSGQMTGINDIPEETDSIFYKEKRFSIIQNFADPFVGELHFELNLPIKQSIFPKLRSGKLIKLSLIFDEVPHQAKLAWSVQIKVKTLKTTRVEVNGNVLSIED